MATIKFTDNSNNKGIEIRILKEGEHTFEKVEISIEVSKPKAGKQAVKIATISGIENGKPTLFKTVDMELVDAIKTFSEVNDTDTITFAATKQEGSRYLDWSLQ